MGMNRVGERGPQPGILKADVAGQLVKDRERETKGEARARLWTRQQLERWDPTGTPGLLDYRWGIASSMLADIQRGLVAETKSSAGEVENA